MLQGNNYGLNAHKYVTERPHAKFPHHDTIR